MRPITILMIHQWDMKDVCWMGYKVSQHNPYTFHHIKKKSDGGKLVVSNGAVLTKYPHEYLHLIEDIDVEMYCYINAILKEINEQGFMPIDRQKKAINFILKQFEREHCMDRTSKGKLLIKEEYIKR